MAPNFYLVCSIQVRKEFFDDFSEYLFRNHCLGIEETGADKGTKTIKIYWPDSNPENIRGIIADFSWKNEGGLSEVLSLQKFQEEDWSVSWRENFRPLHVGKTFYVRPPWSEAHDGKRNLVIYPGRSFGTGYHESTELALMAVESVLEEKVCRTFTDVGAGSGILTVAAMHWPGIKEFRVFEIDESFQEEIPKNVRLSGFESKSLELFPTPFEQFNRKSDIIVANITADVLIELKTDFSKALEKEGRLILSGIHKIFREDFEREFGGMFEFIQEWSKGEWLAYALSNFCKVRMC